MNRPALRHALCAPLLFCALPAFAADEEKKPVIVQNFPETAQAKPAAPAAFAYPTEAAGEGVTTGGYNIHRWAEDWRPLRDPAKRKDVIDQLKFIPLAADGDVYLTLSGELRARMNYFTNPGLKEGEGQRQDSLRIVGGADLHLGTHFRLFGELASGQLGGDNLGVPAANLRNDLVAQQYFAEAKADIGGVALGVRYGRQEFDDGNPLLISSRDNNAIRYVLNGARGWARYGHVRADLFDFKYTALGSEGLSDDRIDDGHRFSGVTAGYAIPKTFLGKSKLYFEPFYWRLRSSKQSWGGQTATEIRHYVGGRLWGSAGDFIIDWTVNHQSGEFGARDIDATQVFLAQSMALGNSAWKPRIGFHADYGTGSNSRGTGTLGVAAAPFGNTIFFSYLTAVSPTNLRMIAPNFAFSPVKPLKLVAEYGFMWRDKLGEPVYKGSGASYAGTATVAGRDIGQVARLQAVWNATKRISLTGRYEHFFTGEVLERANYRDSDYFAGWISWRF